MRGGCVKLCSSVDVETHSLFPCAQIILFNQKVVLETTSSDSGEGKFFVLYVICSLSH